MRNTIHWEDDYDAALNKAKAENKPVFLDFFSSDSIDCRQMDAVTYQKSEVVSYLNKFVISVRVPSDAKLLANAFNPGCVPTSVTIDWNGKEHNRIVGFLAPKEFLLFMHACVSKIYMYGS